MGCGGDIGDIVAPAFTPGNDWWHRIHDPLNVFGGAQQNQPPLPITPAPEPPESTRTAADLNQFGRPEALSVPTFLGINSSMTPSQQLSRIATLGTQGSFGDIRSPTEGIYKGQGASDVARKYFKNLALRTFTNQSGNPMNENDLLPIYEQYLSESLGQPPIEGRTGISHFLTRLSRT